MAQTIQLKRRIPGVGEPGTLAAGEPAVSISATGATGVADMYVGDGTYVHPLVTALRQVEVTGAQTINGAKTIGPTGSLTIGVTGLHIGGGTGGNVLSTDGAGVLSWEEPPKGVETGTTPPSPAAVGDLFYNTTTNKLMVYNGTTWELVNGVTVAATAPTGPAGSLWLNSSTYVLSIYDGTTWRSSTGNRSYLDGATGPAGTHTTGDIWWSDTGPRIWDGAAWEAADIPASVTVGTTGPTPAGAGDLYFNTTTNKLMIHNGTTWEVANGVIIAATAPSGQPTGSLWLHSATHVLSVYDGTAWQSSTGNRSYFGTTGPTGTHSSGDIWWSDDGPQYWDGSWMAAIQLGSIAVVTDSEDAGSTLSLLGDGTTADPLRVATVNGGTF